MPLNASRYQDNDYCIPCWFLYLGMDPGEEACCWGLLSPAEQARYRVEWMNWLRREVRETTSIWRA